MHNEPDSPGTFCASGLSERRDRSLVVGLLPRSSFLGPLPRSGSGELGYTAPLTRLDFFLTRLGLCDEMEGPGSGDCCKMWINIGIELIRDRVLRDLPGRSPLLHLPRTIQLPARKTQTRWIAVQSLMPQACSSWWRAPCGNETTRQECDRDVTRP